MWDVFGREVGFVRPGCAIGENRPMCRNITPLRGLAPAATPVEIDAAALQFIRKVGAFSTVPVGSEAVVARAVQDVAGIVARLLNELPDRRVPPAIEPPLRRRMSSQSSASPMSRRAR